MSLKHAPYEPYYPAHKTHWMTAPLASSWRKRRSLRIAPLNSSDEEGAEWSNGDVCTTTGFRKAFTTSAAGGWVGLSRNPLFGGMEMPKMLVVHVEEMLHTATSNFALYCILASGTCLAIEAQRQPSTQGKISAKPLCGGVGGSMCLTELHTGAD